MVLRVGATAAGAEIQEALIPYATVQGSSILSSAGRGGGGGRRGSFTALLGLPTSQAMELLLPRAVAPASTPSPAPARAPTFPPIRTSWTAWREEDLRWLRRPCNGRGSRGDAG